MSQYDVETIELSLSEAKKKVDKLKSLDKLMSNREFKKLFMDCYFEEECVRLVMLKGHPSQQGKEEQEAILRQMDGITSLRSFLGAIKHAGSMAEKAIEELEATREEMLAEEL